MSQLNTVIFGNSWWTAKYQLSSDAWIKYRLSRYEKETTLRFVQKRRVISQCKGVSMRISVSGGTQLWAFCIMHWRSDSKLMVQFWNGKACGLQAFGLQRAWKQCKQAWSLTPAKLRQKPQDYWEFHITQFTKFCARFCVDFHTKLQCCAHLVNVTINHGWISPFEYASWSQFTMWWDRE
jgi:hypothetical protein